MAKYLYGAVVHGIQSFIFDTGKLKEIIGASEFIEEICTTRFAAAVGKAFNPEQQIIGAAGKIQYLFEDKMACQQFVYGFRRQIEEEVPGLSLAEAIVEVSGELLDKHIARLEKQLAQERNNRAVPHGLGWMITERARRTGGNALAVTAIDDDFVDRSQKTKEEASRNTTLLKKMVGEDAQELEKKAPKLFEDLIVDPDNSWIAVMHADGNNLGRIIQELKDHLTKSKNAQLHEVLKRLSAQLDSATQQAAYQAYKRVIKPVYDKEQQERGKAYLPIRPVLLGGDDITVVIRGELALDFTAEFLRAFAIQTKQAFMPLVNDYKLPMLSDGLTACAGISYIKVKYPFHYGVNLAESLCKQAKAHAKAINSERAPSGLAFHRVQSSFVENYDRILDRELKAGEVSFSFGPYFLDQQDGYDYNTIDQLQERVWQMSRRDAPKASVRTWLQELKLSPESAAQLMKRIRRMNPSYIQRLGLEDPKMRSRASKEGRKDVLLTHLYDTIALVSI